MAVPVVVVLTRVLGETWEVLIREELNLKGDRIIIGIRLQHILAHLDKVETTLVVILVVAGGGYYGGASGYCHGYSGAGGSGYIGGVTGGSMSNGQRTGNGYARITLVE